MSNQFWDTVERGVDYLKAAYAAAGKDPAAVDDMTPAAVIVDSAKPMFWINGGRLFVGYSDGTAKDLGPALGQGTSGRDLGPINGPTPKSYLVSLLRNLTPEDCQEVMGHFCSSCGDEQPDGRRCQCWNDE